MPALAISEWQIQKALELLSSLEPAPLAMYWEYQDDSTSALFVVNVPCKTEAEVEKIYFSQVIEPLREIIPEEGTWPTWMVIFQDASGYLITSCIADNAKYAL